MNAHIRTGSAMEAWLPVIHEANRVDAIFGRPESTGPWWAGGTVEEYEHARVLHRGDGSVSITSKTEHGERVLRQVGLILGIQVGPLVDQVPPGGGSIRDYEDEDHGGWTRDQG